MRYFIFLLNFFSIVNAQGQNHFLENYCYSCHNEEDWAGGLSLENLDLADHDEVAEIQEKIIRKVASGMMPPLGEPRPTEDEAKSYIEELVISLNQNNYTYPNVGLHRLNRAEYENAIEDLLHLQIEVSSFLPVDNSSSGFDNLATSLSASPALIQGYVAGAQKISRLAIGNLEEGQTSVIYKARPDDEIKKHVEGMPLGTRGGLKVEHNFPLDAEYTLKILAGERFGGNKNLEVVITLDDVPIKPVNIRNFTIPISAGRHTLTVSLLDLSKPTGVNDIYSVYQTTGSISSIEIYGPVAVYSKGESASRRKIFTSCYPVNQDQERKCAQKILVNLANQAFRKEIDLNKTDILMNFYDQGRSIKDFEYGIQQGIARILIDPNFLFRINSDHYLKQQESQLNLASNLSFFLWSSLPDSTLINLAKQNQLAEPKVLSHQVERMLDDERSEELINNFIGQWLRLRELSSFSIEAEGFNENLRRAFEKELYLFVSTIFFENYPVTTLIDGNFTFLNEDLAKHYGIDNIYGSYMRRVELDESSPRIGLLGKAALLTVTSTATRTSPVIRGSWVLETFLNAPIPSPPPGVETNLDGDGAVKIMTSVRERLEQHRQDPSCKSCHSVIDPVGFALENFDQIGRWRTKDGNSQLDTTANLNDGTVLKGVEDLRSLLLDRKELFLTVFTQKLLTYALGRELTYRDMPAVRGILQDAKKEEYRVQSFIKAIVKSPIYYEFRNNEFNLADSN